MEYCLDTTRRSSDCPPEMSVLPGRRKAVSAWPKDGDVQEEVSVYSRGFNRLSKHCGHNKITHFVQLLTVSGGFRKGYREGLCKKGLINLRISANEFPLHNILKQSFLHFEGGPVVRTARGVQLPVYPNGRCATYYSGTSNPLDTNTRLCAYEYGSSICSVRTLFFSKLIGGIRPRADICPGFLSKGGSLHLYASSPACNGFLRFTSDVTPSGLLTADPF